MARGLIPFDRRAIGDAMSLAGIDEAGRGALAGPVVAAVVRCEAAFYESKWCRREARKVDDSKRLPPEARAAIVERFKEACHEKWIHIGIGTADVVEIERLNIYQANVLAMRRAFEQVVEAPAGSDLWTLGEQVPDGVPVLIDGKPIRTFPYPHTGVVKGDQRSLAIALAGIHAKEYRDALMRQLDARYPGYGFAAHKGYGTARHVAAIREHGPTPEHRTLFLRKVLQEPEAQSPPSEDSLFPGNSIHS